MKNGPTRVYRSDDFPLGANSLFELPRSRHASRAHPGAGQAGDLALSPCIPEEGGIPDEQPLPARSPSPHRHGDPNTGALGGKRRSDRIVSSYPLAFSPMIDSNG